MKKYSIRIPYHRLHKGWASGVFIAYDNEARQRINIASSISEAMAQIATHYREERWRRLQSH